MHTAHFPQLARLAAFAVYQSTRPRPRPSPFDAAVVSVPGDRLPMEAPEVAEAGWEADIPHQLVSVAQERRSHGK